MFIRDFRKKLNITQSKFAEILGIKQTILSRYENHKLKPTYETIVKLIEIFNANPYFLFFGKEPYLNTDGYKNEISQELIQLINELSLYENEKNIILELENKALKKIISLVPNKEIWERLISLFKIDRRLYFITLFVCKVNNRIKQKSKENKAYLISIINSFDNKNFNKLNHIKLNLITLFNEKFTEEEAKIIIKDCSIIFKHIENTAPIHKMIEINKNN